MRTIVAVDVPNMFFGAKATFQSKLDYRRVKAETAPDTIGNHWFAYVTANQQTNNDSFVAALERANFIVRKKNIIGAAQIRTQYIQMALDLLSFVGQIDSVVIFSGDGEFIPLILHLKSKGIEVVVYSFERSTSREMFTTPTEYREIPESWCLDPEKCFRAQSKMNVHGSSSLGSTARGFVDVAGLPKT